MRSTMSSSCLEKLGGGALPAGLIEARLQAGREHVLRVEARIDVHEHAEAANEERRADEQHHRQRHFDDDERATQPAASAACAGAARAFLQRLREVRPGELQRRYDSEERARDQRKQRGREEHPQIDRDGTDPRHAVRNGRPNDTDGPPRQRHRHDRPHRRQHQTFDHELAHQLPAAGAESRADADLALARARAGKQQVRDVCARRSPGRSRLRRAASTSTAPSAHRRCDREAGARRRACPCSTQDWPGAGPRQSDPCSPAPA